MEVAVVLGTVAVEVGLLGIVVVGGVVVVLLETAAVEVDLGIILFLYQ